jgi:uncharacterized spore protein YtfJ
MVEQQPFDPGALTRAAQDTFTVRRVFGDPYERDGVLVVPVARVLGGVGAGSGGGEGAGVPARFQHGGFAAADEPAAPGTGASGEHGETHGQGHGGGGGYGAQVKPLGVYVVDAAGAHWQPVVDVTRIVLGMELAVSVVLSIGLVARALRRR